MALGTTTRARLLLLTSLCACLGRVAAADDDEPEVVEDACALGKGHSARLVTSTEPTACGSGGCSVSQTLSIVDVDGSTLVEVTNELGDFAGEEMPFSLSCEHASVVVGDGSGLLFALRYEKSRESLALPPSIRSSIEAGFRRAPAAAKPAERRIRLAHTLEAIAPAAAPAPGAPARREIHGLDAPLVQSAWLLAARDGIASGAWETGERILADVERTKPDGVALRRLDALKAKLASLRARSAPVRVVERHRIGSVQRAQTLPVHTEVAPTLFWRGDSLCVAQEDANPPKAMRCIDAATQRWGAREPLQLPAATGAQLKGFDYPNVVRCEGGFVLQKRVPGGPNDDACRGGPGVPADDFVGVVEVDTMLLAGETGGLYVNRGPGKDEAVTPAQASELLKSSAGSLVAGNACCRFLFTFADVRLVRLDATAAEQRYEIRGTPPAGEYWWAVPLVSPSQAWLVTQSRSLDANVGGRTLWLMKLQSTR